MLISGINVFNNIDGQLDLIRKKFNMLRSQKVRTSDAIDALREEYPYLQFDTIRKIVHNPPKQVSRS